MVVDVACISAGSSILTVTCEAGWREDRLNLPELEQLNEQILSFQMVREPSFHAWKSSLHFEVHITCALEQRRSGQ